MNTDKNRQKEKTTPSGYNTSKGNKSVTPATTPSSKKLKESKKMKYELGEENRLSENNLNEINVDYVDETTIADNYNSRYENNKY